MFTGGLRVVGRMHAREKNREFTACDKCYGKTHGSGRMRAKQERCGASNVRATQRDADGSRHARLGEVQISRACEKAQAAFDSLSNVAHKTVTAKTAHHEMSSAAVWIVVRDSLKRGS
jgi:hypothetical protein